MSNHDKKPHTIEFRDIVKENAKYYRDTEIARINNEDYTHFLQANPEYKEDRDILDKIIT